MLANKSSSPAAADKKAVGENTIDLPPTICIHKNSRIEGVLRSPLVPASENPGITGIATRDVVVDRRTGVAARLFLPIRSVATGRRLPLVLFFHGSHLGAASPFCRTYHRYATSLAARAEAVVVSVEYRLPAEHPGTAAYDDAWTALRWAASCSDPWLMYHADPGRTFLAGDGAGGDVAYHTAVRAAGRTGEGIHVVEGLLLVTPRQVDTQGTNDDVPRNKLPCEEIASVPCRRALVAVAGTGAELGSRFTAGMHGSLWLRGGEATVVGSHGEDRGFQLYAPERASNVKLVEREAGFHLVVVEFINRELTPAQKQRDNGSTLKDQMEASSGVTDCAEAAPRVFNGTTRKALLAEVLPRTFVIKSCL